MSSFSTTPNPAQVLSDPNFLSLPGDQQRIVMGRIDPNFSALPPDEQTKVLIHAQNNRPLSGGVKVTGQNAKGQNIVAPEGQSFGRELLDEATNPENIGNFISSAWTEAKGIPASIRGLFAPPQTAGDKVTTAISGPVGTAVKRMIQSELQSRGAVTQQAADQFKRGEIARGVNSTLSAAVPLPGVPGMVAGINQAEDQGQGAQAAGKAATDALVMGTGLAERPISAVMRKGASILTGGAKTAAVQNAIAKAANDAEVLKANEVNAKADAARAQELNDHFQAIQKAKGEEPTTVGSIPDDTGGAGPARLRNARELQSHKAALERGVEQLDTQFKNDLISTAKDAKAQLDAKYDFVRQALEPQIDPATGEATPAPSIPAPDLASAVRNAESNLMGSSENIKQFRDILSKYPESDPDFVEYQGAQIPKGHPLYDVIKGDESSPGATFRDLQGYYTELGEKLSAGNLLPDVYRAMKSLHDSIGGMMNDLATQAGVADKLDDAQSYARRYYADWRDSISPLYRAIKKSPEAGDAISKFRGKDQSGIATLARYNPELAKRANTIRGYQQQAASISSKPFVEKPVSALAPSKPPVQPELQTIGPEDIQAANAAELAKRTATMRHYVNKAAFYVTGYRSLIAVGRALSGDTGALSALPADIGEGLAVAAGGNGLANLLDSPRISKLLTQPTAAQAATIDPEIARGLQPIVDAAKKKGIKVSPAITAAISAHATGDRWWDQPIR